MPQPAPLRPFGQAGGAAGVELDGGVGRPGRPVGIDRRLAIAPVSERLPGAVAAAEGDDLGDGLELVADLLDHGKILFADEQDLGLGVVDDVQHFRWREPPVDRDHHRIGLGRAEQQLEEDVAALVEMGHPGLRPDAFGDQRVGHPARGAVERGVGGGAASMDDGGNVGAKRRMVTHDVGQSRNLDAHRTFSTIPSCHGYPEATASFGDFAVISRV